MVIEPFPKALVRKIEKHETLPLFALAGITELRSYLDELEVEAIIKARQLGATVEDIADALGLTRQAIYYKLKTLAGEEGATDEPPESETEAGPTESVTVIVLPDTEEAPIPADPGAKGRHV